MWVIHSVSHHSLIYLPQADLTTVLEARKYFVLRSAAQMLKRGVYFRLFRNELIGGCCPELWEKVTLCIFFICVFFTGESCNQAASCAGSNHWRLGARGCIKLGWSGDAWLSRQQRIHILSLMRRVFRNNPSNGSISAATGTLWLRNWLGGSVVRDNSIPARLLPLCMFFFRTSLPIQPMAHDLILSNISLIPWHMKQVSWVG